MLKVKDTVTENLLPRPKRFESRKAFYVYTVCWSITVVTMLSSIAMTLLNANNPFEKMIEHVALCLGGLVFLNIAPLMHKYGIRIPAFIQITITALIFGHFVLGEVYRFYDHVYLFDKMLHLANGIIIAACGFSIVYGFSKTENGLRMSPFFAGMFSFCFALALLTLWEVFEYLVDTIGGFNMQRWKDNFFELSDGGVMKYFVKDPKQGSGLVDTMTDLIIGILGAAGVSVIGGLWFKKDPNVTKFLILRNKPNAP